MAVASVDGHEADQRTGGHVEEDGQQIGPKGAQHGLPAAIIDQQGVDQLLQVQLGAQWEAGAEGHGQDWKASGREVEAVQEAWRSVNSLIGGDFRI